jgi:hypothetical protein
VKLKKLKIENLSCHESQLRDFILPILRGNVFHVTTRSGFKGISKNGLIRNNKDGDLPYTYQKSARSYARTRGYVSLFDLRTTSGDELETALSNFYFLNPPFADNNPIFLILSPSLYPMLIPWTRARDEHPWTEAFIPHVESFYQGNIPASNLSRVIAAKITRTKRRQSSLSRRMDKAVQELYAPGRKSL